MLIGQGVSGRQDPQKCHFLLLIGTTLTTVLHYRADCDLYSHDTARYLSISHKLVFYRNGWFSAQKLWCNWIHISPKTRVLSSGTVYSQTLNLCSNSIASTTCGLLHNLFSNKSTTNQSDGVYALADRHKCCKLRSSVASLSHLASTFLYNTLTIRWPWAGHKRMAASSGKDNVAFATKSCILVILWLMWHSSSTTAETCIKTCLRYLSAPLYLAGPDMFLIRNPGYARTYVLVWKQTIIDLNICDKKLHFGYFMTLFNIFTREHFLQTMSDSDYVLVCSYKNMITF